MDIKDYIYGNWDNTIRHNTQDCETLIGLPYPYTVPCCDNHFQELYYWDTYFTNVGLMHSGRAAQAKYNIDNMCYLIEKYGYMPNGNRTFYLSRSQPPFLSQMVRELYSKLPDAAWLTKCYHALEKEYAFWQSDRITSSGLNRYYGFFTATDEIPCSYELCARFQIPQPEDEETQRRYGRSMYTFAESGWDCNSRMGVDVYQYNWLDLNALLYGMEQNMAYFSETLGNGREDFWLQQSALRAERMNALMWDENMGCFFDFNYETNERTDIVSVATFYPLFTGLCTQEQAARIVATLPKLEQTHGIASCEAQEELYDLQWDYPNGWACLQYIVIHGLLRYGYKEAALRIAQKYTQLVERVFRETGHLWEKYNVVSGTVSTAKEYETPAMMGWSAGVYLDCRTLISTPD